jgi:signal transduction histidine kinase
MKTFSASLIEQIETLTKIADEFSNFAQMPRTQNEELNLDVVLQTIVALFKSTEHFDISYENQMENEPLILADKDQVIRVFNNLITNAIQAIPEDQEGKIEMKLRKDGSKVVVEVMDNGIGIALAEQDKIFVPNFTTKTTGTGLGLAMVKDIVGLANGEVWFHSKEHIGSTFFVGFPLISQ